MEIMYCRAVYWAR